MFMSLKARLLIFILIIFTVSYLIEIGIGKYYKDKINENLYQEEAKYTKYHFKVALERSIKWADDFLTNELSDSIFIKQFSNYEFDHLQEVSQGTLLPLSNKINCWHTYTNNKKLVFAASSEPMTKFEHIQVHKLDEDNDCFHLPLNNDRTGFCFDFDNPQHPILWVSSPIYNIKGENSGFSEVALNINTILKSFYKSIETEVAITNNNNELLISTNNNLFNEFLAAIDISNGQEAYTSSAGLIFKLYTEDLKDQRDKIIGKVYYLKDHTKSSIIDRTATTRKIGSHSLVIILFTISLYLVIAKIIKSNDLMVATIKKQNSDFEAIKNYTENIIESSPGVLLVLDSNLKILNSNHKADLILVGDQKKAIGIDFTKYLFEGPELFYENISKGPFDMDILMKDPQGNQLIVSTTFSHLYSEATEKFEIICSGKDVTAQRKAEQERIDAQRKAYNASKLESVGVMASGFAHELNNPLTIMLGYSSIIVNDPSNQELVSTAAKEISVAGERMAAIINDIKQLSNQADKAAIVSDLIHINILVQNVTGVLAENFNAINVKFKLELSDEVLVVKGKIVELKTVFNNILFNSRDSFKEMLKEGLQPAKMEVVIKTITMSANIFITITDNAGGISSETLKNIFDPFFTTKSPGQGTGLGLSKCRDIIKKHKGEIKIDSVLGEGTVSTIILPRYKV